MYAKLTSPSVVTEQGTQQVTSLSSAAGLSVPDGACYAYLQAEGQDVRFRADGTDPTASVGMLLKAGAQPFPYVGDLSALRFIEATSGATLNVHYMGMSGS